jgi:2-hydroxychromene-2-carboxylate isomerase
MQLDWYFDFVSPFAYLQFARLRDLPATIALELRPVLLAGLLTHWGQLGPAEIAPKRRFTYAHVTWLAARAALPFTMPVGHPFNSLPLLRLALAVGPTMDVVARLFRFVWVEGHIPQEPQAWAALLAEFGSGVQPEAESVKARLRSATEAAAAAGVFGVPAAIAGGQLFWGYDATDMLFDYCRDPAAFTTPAQRRAAEVPIAATRASAKPG